MLLFLMMACGSGAPKAVSDSGLAENSSADTASGQDTGLTDTGGSTAGLDSLEASAGWVSQHDGYGTGGAFMDLDNDGDQDLVVAHGNDMEPGRIAVFKNVDGVLDEEPAWLSDNPAYYGHLDLGDVNNDGFTDLVVARFLGPDRFDEPGGVELFLNREGVLDATPSWEASGFFSFSVSLGDMDGDGLLDLGVAVGEAYENEPDYARVFRGDGLGGFGDSPVWMAPEAHYSFDVAWADFNGDGWLDLVLAQQQSGHRIYPNIGGTLSSVPMWIADDADGPFEGNTLDVGDVDGDGIMVLVVSDNDQLGGLGVVRLWCGPDLEVCHEVRQEYASAVDLYDFDEDGDLDLAYGGWWSPVSILENQDGRLSSEPCWVSEKSDIVVEALDWADVDGQPGAELMVTDWTRTSGNRIWLRERLK